MYDSCEKAKVIKYYNHTPQERAKRLYQFLYTDLIGPIIPMGFGAKRYFFIFTDDNTYIIKTYTGIRKSKWLKSFKAFYNLVCIYIGLDRPIERLQSYYSLKIPTRKVDK